VIVCKQCGHHNEDNDTFCGSCGKFLEWTGERVAVAEPEPEPPAPEAEPEPAHVGLIDRVKHAVGIEESTPQPAAPTPSAPPPVVAPAAATAAAPPPEPGAPAPQVVWTVPVTSAAPSAPAPPAPPAAPVLAGVAAPAAPAASAAPPAISVVQPDEPMSRRPTSVAPAVARPRPTARTMEAPTRRHPGDLICGQCGEGNDPTRHFCRRCGSSLDEAIAVRLPWYRRFLNRVFGVKTREAGWRPHRVGPPNVMGVVWRILRLAIIAIIAVALLAFLLVPSFHNAVVNRVTSTVTTVRKAFFAHYSAVYATGASASTSIAGHLPNLVIDTHTNTYWAARAGDPGPFLKLSFHDPVDLAQIGFDSGAAGTTPVDDYLAQPRPHQVHLVFSNGTTLDLTLKDEDPKVAKNAQFYAIDARQVTFVEIHITSVYAPAGASPSSVAIAEVEFKVKD
jgi:zinc ribbon protein